MDKIKDIIKKVCEVPFDSWQPLDAITSGHHKFKLLLNDVEIILAKQAGPSGPYFIIEGEIFDDDLISDLYLKLDKLKSEKIVSEQDRKINMIYDKIMSGANSNRILE